jgi:hypothetical protein
MDHKYLSDEQPQEPFSMNDVIRYLVLLDYIVLLIFLIPISIESYGDILQLLQQPNPLYLVRSQFDTLSNFSGGFFPELLYTTIIGIFAPMAIYLATKSSSVEASNTKARLISIVVSFFLIFHFVVDQKGNRSSTGDGITFIFIIIPLLLYSIKRQDRV